MKILSWVTEKLRIGYKRIAYFPFIFALVAIEIYFWINGPAHFADWSSTYGNTILIYIGMTMIFLFWSGRGTQEQMRTPLIVAMPVFVLFFIGTYMILFFIDALNLIQVTPLDPSLFWQTVLMQVCVVACAEELMFRGVLLELTGVIFSSICFALWHAYAYGIQYFAFNLESVGSVIFAFVMGLLLAFIAKQKRFSLPATVGVHAAYNLFIVGAFFAL